MGINDMWIGANDMHREGTMVWVSDKTYVSKGFSNWPPGEPNNGGQLWLSYGYYKWNDGDCSRKFGFICKK